MDEVMRKECGRDKVNEVEFFFFFLQIKWYNTRNKLL